MYLFNKYLYSVLTGVIAISLSSCNYLHANTSNKTNLQSLADQTNFKTPLKADKSTLISAKTVNPTIIVKPQITTNINKKTAIATSKNSITATIYQADNQCQNLVPKKVVIPAKNSLQAALGEVLEPRNSDFILAGYRVSVNSNRVATVDLRVAPDSQRTFTSLSSCEQFALFGSIKKTLTNNPTWKIKEVRFTQQGEEIYL
ncbi:hypothetical protein Cri9333_1036 [Crinalium epipsammum PCC 9333]|uniref:Sporulation/spore germination protein n=1 Tax=Crinalium epipsammum PCC 9333 TaxID=1173022 RepID=K9VXS1_9CYAN|nr:GerMN domain-containing protein [Crinalium epipsammum]AFZ11950.1 hypothetical protein Cri9333_1036 [Crinalium epipsammum PCC 9333]